MSGIRRDERGMVSIMVTMIMMIVITLIVIGFVQVTNRNRREVLDRQLSTQAFYAAESGINSAINAINATPDPTTLPARTQCADTNTSYGAQPLSFSAASNIQVTCLLVNPTVSSLVGTSAQGASSVLRVNPTQSNGTSANLYSLTFKWSAQSGQPATACTSTVGQFAASAGTCGFGLLRVDLLQSANSSTNMTGDMNYFTRTASIYLQPTGAGGAAADISAAYCANGTGCPPPTAFIVAGTYDGVSQTYSGTVVIPGATGNRYYEMRLTSLYRDVAKWEVSGTLTNGSQAYFTGSQMIIDATGKAQDVLRRVQVRYNPNSAGDIPSMALQSAADMCKQLTVVDALTVTKGSCN